MSSANTTPLGADETYHSVLFQDTNTGTISLATALPQVETPMRIVGNGKDSNTVARAADSAKFRIFEINNDKTTNLIADLTISNGDVTGQAPSEGGGIYVRGGGSLNLSKCKVSNNKAESGGGISIMKSSVFIVDCEIVANQATQDNGGGILVFGNGASVSIRYTMIAANSAVTYGGGIAKASAHKWAR